MPTSRVETPYCPVVLRWKYDSFKKTKKMFMTIVSCHGYLTDSLVV